MCYTGINFPENWQLFCFYRLFLKQDLWSTKQNQRMLLFTGRGNGEHPTLIGLWVGLLESTIFLVEKLPMISWSFLLCWGSNSFKNLITELVGVGKREEYTVLVMQMQWHKISKAHWGSSRYSKSSRSTIIFPIFSLIIMQSLGFLTHLQEPQDPTYFVFFLYQLCPISPSTTVRTYRRWRAIRSVLA